MPIKIEFHWEENRMESITTSSNSLTDMDIVEFAENVFGIKLLEYQK